MSKAVLVLDEMPRACDAGYKDGKNCPLFCAESYCMGAFKAVTSDCVDCDLRRPDWCPLKEMPNYYPDRTMPFAYSDNEAAAYNDGWNDCLDKILENKGGEENGKNAD